MAAATSLDTGRALALEPALTLGSEKEGLHRAPSPPAPLGQALEAEQCGGRNPTGAEAGPEGEAAEDEPPGPEPMAQLQPQGGVWLEDPPPPLGGAEEGPGLSRTPWGHEGASGLPPGSPEDALAAGCPEPVWLPCPAQGEEDRLLLAPGPALEEEASRTERGPGLPLADRGVVAEGGSLWEGRGLVQEESCCIQAEEEEEEEASGEEPECPICTELYDRDRHRPALLNCSHVLCGQCLRAIMEAASAADIGRVRCPICRQKTPMMEWEICKLQEELLLLGSEPGGQASAAPAPAFQPLPARRPGLWGRLEHHFQVRFHTTRLVGFLPCLRYPPCLIRGLQRLESRCRCLYLSLLLLLLLAEMLSLLLVFFPIALLLFIFLILER
ncbi:ring finger protein-like [Hemicordylus capensis]|uniref:ring finger protein-like n=1 Tax=Hemicordylus capensis TaxID=884348 RepID=UPI002303F886|nr:ring finger protein-like [Hemicordylus capensis]